jgi:hypothetical protein
MRVIRVIFALWGPQFITPKSLSSVCCFFFFFFFFSFFFSLSVPGTSGPTTAASSSLNTYTSRAAPDPARPGSSASAEGAGGAGGGGHPRGLARVLAFYLWQCRLCERVGMRLDFLGRTAELARAFGIRFADVLFRGSQFRVESVMLRVARPLRFLATALSKEQVAGVEAEAGCE